MRGLDFEDFAGTTKNQKGTGEHGMQTEVPCQDQIILGHLNVSIT